MAEEPDVEEHDLVQIDPQAEHVAPAFRGCFAVVTEPKPWGFQGYVPAIGELLSKPSAQAYIRVRKGQYVVVGRAEWVISNEEKETSDG